MTLQRSWRGWAVMAVGAWLLTLALNRSLRRVTGESMAPTLSHGDLVLALPWLTARPGDVVVARDPRDGQPWVKRLAAVGPARVELPGRVVAVPSGRVLLLGDNPSASTDGRVLGPTPAVDVTHRVVARLDRSTGRRRMLSRMRVHPAPNGI